MSRVDTIRRRMERKKRRSRHKGFRALPHFVMALMIGGVGTLSFLIAARLQLPFAANVLDYMQQIQWSEYLPFDTWFPAATQSVASINGYEEVGEDRYHNGTNQAQNIAAGVVTHIEQQNDTWCVTLRQDDGVFINYAHLQEAQVKEGEKLAAGATLGVYQEYVEIRCFQDGNELPLTEAAA